MVHVLDDALGRITITVEATGTERGTQLTDLVAV
jgi:hypothetical protein